MKKFISVIICTCNRQDSIQDTFNSLLKLKTDETFDWELIVVENNPQPIMKSLVLSFELNFQGRLHYHLETQQGKSFALNRGIRESKGELLLFTDDDAIVDSNWMHRIVQFFSENSCDGIGGRVLPIYPENTPQWIKDHADKLASAVVIYDYGEDIKPYRLDMHAFIGANFAFRRQMFEELGYFREDLGPGASAMGEDTEFTHRLAKRQKMLYYCGNVLVWHPYDPARFTLKHMAKWHIRIGRFAARCEIENHGLIQAYIGGVPRYIFKGIGWNVLGLIAGIFNRIVFLNHWRSLFRYLGMIDEYRSQNYRKKYGTKTT